MKLQIGDSPGAPTVLAAVAFAVLGLCLSLFIRPRRVWVRVSEDRDGVSVLEVSVLEVGGLDRADARAGLTEDVAALAQELSGTSPGSVDPSHGLVRRRNLYRCTTPQAEAVR